MSRADVNRSLLNGARIAARITAILGDLEQRLSDRVFKTVAQRIATNPGPPHHRPQPPAGARGVLRLARGRMTVLDTDRSRTPRSDVTEP